MITKCELNLYISGIEDTCFSAHVSLFTYFECAKSKSYKVATNCVCTYFFFTKLTKMSDYYFVLDRNNCRIRQYNHASTKMQLIGTSMSF